MLLFSLIIPVYNTERYLEDCINSVLKQTYKNYEIILVDDGSFDESSKICDLYSDQYDCIVTLHQRNSGPIQARINGAKRAKGDFLLFLDSDDMLRNDALEIISNVINVYHADLVMFCASVSKNFDVPFKTYPFEKSKVFLEQDKTVLYELICTTPVINELALKCFHKSLFNYSFIGEDEKNVRNGDDCLLSLPIIDKAKTVVFINYLIYYYRKNEQSIVHLSNPKCFDSYRVVSEYRLAYAKKWENKCLGILNKTKCFAGEQCYTAMRNVMISNMSWKEKLQEIKRIKDSDFYIKYHTFLPESFSLMKRVFYSMWRSNNIIISNLATIIYRSARG